MNNIKELCTCSICYSFIEDQIYQCENGHIYCNTCVNNISHCGTCRCENYKIRNLVLESLRDKLKLNNDTEIDDDIKSETNNKEIIKINENTKNNEIDEDLYMQQNYNIIDDIDNYSLIDDIGDYSLIDDISNCNINEINENIKNYKYHEQFIKKNYNNIMTNLEYNFDNLKKIKII